MKRTFPFLIGISFLYVTLLFVTNGAASTNQEVAPSNQPTESQPAESAEKSATIPILMYHYIRTVTNPYDHLGIGLSVTPEHFEEQMSYLVSQGYTTVTLDDLVAHWKTGAPLPNNPIILTFDDGYGDLYTAALPVLQKYNLKATAYITTDHIDTPNYLTGTQLHELTNSPLITIAAHTMTHPDLRNISPGKLHHEIVGSKSWLEGFTGRPVLHFAYPAGRYNEYTMREVRRAGFETATTTDGGTYHASRDRFATTRTRIHGSMTIETFKKMFVTTPRPQATPTL